MLVESTDVAWLGRVEVFHSNGIVIQLKISRDASGNQIEATQHAVVPDILTRPGSGDLGPDTNYVFRITAIDPQYVVDVISSDKAPFAPNHYAPCDTEGSGSPTCSPRVCWV